MADDIGIEAVLGAGLKVSELYSKEDVDEAAAELELATGE